MSDFVSDQQGSVMVFVALGLMVFFGFMAFSIDVGHWFAVKNELRNAADSLALAGTRAYYPPNISGSVAINPDKGLATVAVTMDQRDNRADTKTLIQASNVQYGIWNYLTNSMEDWYWPLELGAFKGPAVSLEFRKESGLNDGPAQNFFGSFLNAPTTDIRDHATAALSGVGEVYKGDVDLPIAVGDRYAMTTDEITLRPSWSDTGGWTSFFIPNPNPNIIIDLINNGNPTTLTANVDSINLQNGVDASVFNRCLVDLWNVKKASGTPWIVTLPIVSADTNYVQSRLVLGFASFQITDVLGPPDKIIKVVPRPGRILTGAGSGGRYYGLMSVQPKLVQ